VSTYGREVKKRRKGLNMGRERIEGKTTLEDGFGVLLAFFVEGIDHFGQIWHLWAISNADDRDDPAVHLYILPILIVWQL
jgi:hypothetical protein